MSVLVRGDVRRTLFAMALPMLAGTFAMNAYNLVDTWFISRLGTLPLAAMGYVFPVVMACTFLAGGIGTGATSLMSHAIGRGDRAAARRIVTHGILLVLAVSLFLTTAGLATIDPLFRLFGAEPRLLPLIGEFMGVWYAGAATMVLPMFGGGLLISAGDSAGASGLMMLGTLLNLLLDPILIFGLAGFPALGMRGAAIATVIAQGVATARLLHLLRRRHGLLRFDRDAARDVLASVRRILALGIPSVFTMVLMPLSAAILTWVVSGFGSAAVAACAAAGRIEMFAFIVPMALGISLTPFVSQNFGAGRLDRIREGRLAANRFALLYGAAVATLFIAFAPRLASLFSDDPAVIAVFVAHVRIISLGYGMMEVHRYSGFVLTGLHTPLSAAALNAIRVLGLLLPLTLLGARLHGVTGIFLGRLATDLIVGALGIFWVSRTLSRREGAPAG